jgi:hypothetical protein
MFDPTLANSDLYPAPPSSVLPVPYSPYVEQPMQAYTTDPRLSLSPHSTAFEAGPTVGYEFPTFTISMPGV